MKNLRSIVKSAKTSSLIVTLVTHDGLCHTDDIMCTALLKDYLERQGIIVKIIRTREEKEIPQSEEVIIFDVFGGDLDHHKDDTIDRGRCLSSIGKVWGWGKNEFKYEYGLDEMAWRQIDRNFIKPIDVTDNTGEMNALNYTINAYRCMYVDDKDLAFRKCVEMAGMLLTGILYSGQKETAERKVFKDLPIKNLGTLKYKISESRYVIPDFSNGQDFDGYIWKTEGKDTYCFRLCNPEYRIKPGQSDHGDVVFSHKTGFMAEVRKLEAIETLIEKA